MVSTIETTAEDDHHALLKQNGVNSVSSIPPRAKSIVGRHDARRTPYGRQPGAPRSHEPISGPARFRERFRRHDS